MNKKLLCIAVFAMFFLSACTKEPTEAVVPEASNTGVEQVSAAQQAAIDAIDQPILNDENNTEETQLDKTSEDATIAKKHP